MCINQVGWTGAGSQGQDHLWDLEGEEASEVGEVHLWVALEEVEGNSGGETGSPLKEAGGMRCPLLPRG